MQEFKFQGKAAVAFAAILVLIGVAILLFTAYLAYQEYLGIHSSVFGSPNAENVTAMVNALVPKILYYGVRLAFLSILVWIGSIFTFRGVQMLGGKTK